jgi:hypothetical protein
MCESAREKPRDSQIYSHFGSWKSWGIINLWIKVNQNLIFVRSLERSLKNKINRGHILEVDMLIKNMKVCRVITRNKIDNMTMMHP